MQYKYNQNTKKVAKIKYASDNQTEKQQKINTGPKEKQKLGKITILPSMHEP